MMTSNIDNVIYLNAKLNEQYSLIDHYKKCIPMTHHKAKNCQLLCEEYKARENKARTKARILKHKLIDISHKALMDCLKDEQETILEKMQKNNQYNIDASLMRYMINEAERKQVNDCV